MKKTIPIFYAIDDEYSKFVAVSIKSLIMNANKDYNYDINIIESVLEKYNFNINTRSENIPYYVFVELANELLK